MTDLVYFIIKDTIAAGKVSNMPDIIEVMHEAGKVIHI